MFDQARFGCILPEGLTVVATAFGKVISARNIDRDSDEADCLARRAVSLYMNGIREEWELELRLRNSCRQFHEHTSRHSRNSTQVLDLLPQLSAWARGLTSSSEEAITLSERTLQYAIDHIAELVEATDVRGWLVRTMVEFRLDRSRRATSSKSAGETDGL